MSKSAGTLPKKDKRLLMRQENFDEWLAFYKGKFGNDLLQWPPHAREWYRSIEMKNPTGSRGGN